MELLLVIAAVVWVILSSAKNVNKAKDAQRQKASRPQAAQRRQSGAEARKPAQPKPQPYRPITLGGSLGEYTPMQSSEGLSAYKPLEHRLDTSGRRAEFVGSLGVGSSEGMDTCDPTLEHGVKEDDLGMAFANTTGAERALRFDRRALLQGVVMSEILTRPSQRKWGRRAHG